MKPIGRREFVKYWAGLAGLLLLGKYTRLPFPLLSTEGTGAEEPAQKTAERAVDGWETVVEMFNEVPVESIRAESAVWQALASLTRIE